MKKLSIIIPCWNEKTTIQPLIKKIEALVISEWTKEIIIIDDHSTDGSREILEKYADKYTVLYHDKNLGKGSAVKTGLEKMTGNYALIQDADLEYEPEEIPKLLHALDTTTKKVVYGSRNIHPSKQGMRIARAGVWLMTHEFNILFGTHLTDIWTCYKLFPKEASKYFDAGHFESELSFSARLIKNGYHIVEVPITYHPRSFEQGKKIRYADGFKGIWTIVKERFTR